MDIYDSRYLVINKTFLTIAGLWPYEQGLKQLLRRYVFTTIIGLLALSHITGLQKSFGADVDMFLEHLGVLLYTLGAMMKVVTSVWFKDKFILMFDSIAENWKSIVDKNEREKLIYYSERGRILTLAYTAYMFSAVIAFTLLPLTPVIMDIVSPLNESRPHLFILNGEFIVDRDKHYTEIYIFDVTTCLFSAFVVVAVDSNYVSCVEHCLGLFAIVQYRLRQPGKLVYDENATKLQQRDASYDWVRETVKLHKIIVQFTTTLESTYSSSFLVNMGINLLYFSIVCVLVQINSGNMFNLIRYIMLAFGLLVYFFYLSWPGQKLTNHSTDLYVDAYYNEWYEGSPKTKKLLRFFTLRCSVPCILTAGGLYTMNFENYLAVMKTSVSYIAVFSSFR